MRIDEAAGVFGASAGLKTGPEDKSLTTEGGDITVTDGPFAESKEMGAGFQIWTVKDMDEALAWARRAPVCMPGKNHMEIRAFYEPEDLSEFVSPEELAAPRDGDRGKLGVA